MLQPLCCQILVVTVAPTSQYIAAQLTNCLTGGRLQVESDELRTRDAEENGGSAGYPGQATMGHGCMAGPMGEKDLRALHICRIHHRFSRDPL